MRRAALDERLHSLIGRLYEAATLPVFPADLVEEIKSLTESTSTTFALHGEQNLSTLYVSGADPAFAPLANHFAVTRQNLYQERAHLALVGTAIFGHQLASRDELIGTPFFEEFLRPAGAVHMLGLSLVREPGRFAELSLFREERLEPHGDEELRIGNVLAGHLRRALLFGLSFRAADARAENLGAVLESFCVGTVLIDIDGKLVFANAEAIALLTGRAP